MQEYYRQLSNLEDLACKLAEWDRKCKEDLATQGGRSEYTNENNWLWRKFFGGNPPQPNAPIPQSCRNKDYYQKAVDEARNDLAKQNAVMIKECTGVGSLERWAKRLSRKLLD
jgi:hypothetical protein